MGRWLVVMLVVAGSLSVWGVNALGQAPAAVEPYTIPVHVDEVSVTFNAVDEKDKVIEDLQLTDLRVVDNGKKAKRLISLRKQSDLPLRVGIVVDTSGSMRQSLWRTRRIAAALSTKILRHQSDRAFVMRFDFSTLVKQDWTDESAALDDGVQRVAEDAASRLGGTALYDTVYTACRDKFGKELASGPETANFILLFTDGIDNRSHALMEDVIDICQQTHTAIYIFANDAKAFHDAGQKVLQELAAKSGGRIFYDNGKNEVVSDLRLIERDLRNKYVVVYKPGGFKADGSFHKIKLDCPKRTAFIFTRTGYYARR